MSSLSRAIHRGRRKETRKTGKKKETKCTGLLCHIAPPPAHECSYGSSNLQEFEEFMSSNSRITVPPFNSKPVRGNNRRFLESDFAESTEMITYEIP
ncbi:hypothetical protein MUK42_36298 [Musa troglodytarum]|uniref:Uncharacterized protein n=1 Tax=Musa troglodytarum TaxID=320322 RepID=A0A9E7JBI5_9LILI|nr:hypothetical protein MUK42_36298 [Musa troglodytarum]